MSAPPPTSVSQSRKAAMVVQLLLRDGGDLPLSQLPEEAQARLTRELGSDPWVVVLDLDAEDIIATTKSESP